VDPGVPPVWKFIHALLTYSVFFPSLLTAFTVIASMERAGRVKGGKGLFGWVTKLPWGDPSVSAQLLAGFLFLFGGIGGLTNASYNINLVIHNTAWVPGHLHLTVATAVTLSFMGISYWLVPYLTGKKLWDYKFKLLGVELSFAVLQTWLWFIGMIIFSNAMHVVGLLGAPRRTPLGLAPYVPEEWSGHLLRVGIGGAILGISGLMYLTTMIITATSKKVIGPGEEIQVPISEAVHDPQETPDWLDKWLPWLIATIALIIIAYGPQLIDQIANMQLTSPGFKVW
jgi:cytochrome c oxidase subunit 1